MAALRALAAAAAGAEHTAAAGARALQVLREVPRDVPFALLYLLDPAGLRAALSGTVGVQPGSACAPLSVDLLTAASGWPLGKVARQGAPLMLNDLASRLRGLERGPWPEPPESAMLLPLRVGGDAVGAVLVAAPLEDLLESREALAPPLRRELELAARNAARLLNLVDTLLDFSQVEAGRMRAHFAPVDLPALTLRVVALFRGAIEAAGLKL